MAGSPASAPQLLLAFDYGTRRIGVASGDTLTRTARAVATLDCSPRLPWPAIDKLVAELQPAQLIVGLPRNMDGTPATLAGASRGFAAELASRYGKPVALVDETLSSREAEADLREARASGLKRKRTTHGDVDKVAARILIERWLENPGAAEAVTIARHES